MTSIGGLISGYRVFKATEYQKYKDVIGHVVELGQKPKTLVVACCDMRLAPGRIVSANPGDLYVIRNIGGLVPPFDPNGKNSTIAAIEYAVRHLQVENIIVMGHNNCDAMKLLMEGGDALGSQSMEHWLAIANEARDAVNNQLAGKSSQEKEWACGQESILVSLRNLISYPWIEEGIKADSVKIYGWQYDIVSGQLYGFDPIAGVFDVIE
tara:strand:- start:475 stop:1104 length:630 start_codon:yes stop_codon:yes gene_type:complete